MITNTGKDIISKYLIGHTASYASHLAFGSGPEPLATEDRFGNYSTKTSLDFEMFRVPITSRSVVVEDGITKVILTAELPTTGRYEITEIGVYPSEINPVVTGLDSQTIYSFLVGEAWKYVTSSATIDIPIILDDTTNSNNDITVTDKAFFTNVDSPIFDSLLNPERISRHERPRFLDSTLLLCGDTSTSLTVSGSDMTIGAGSNYISLSVNPILLDKNSTEDELRLAFSIVNKDGIASTDIPSNIKILLRFSNTLDAGSEYSSFTVDLDSGGRNINNQTPTYSSPNITLTTSSAHGIAVGEAVNISGVVPAGYNGTWIAQTGTTGSTLVVNIGSNPGAITAAGKVVGETQWDFTNNRYVISKKKIKDLYKTADFNWADVKFAKLYFCANNGSTGNSDFYVALDALRLENISSFSPVYGLTAYTVTKTSDSFPILKSSNTSNFIEFKYALGVS
jgi:hypothetical protein